MTAEVEFDLTCGECGGNLDGDFVARRGAYGVIVGPCQKCIEAATEAGREEGRQEAE